MSLSNYPSGCSALDYEALDSSGAVSEPIEEGSEEDYKQVNEMLRRLRTRKAAGKCESMTAS